MSKVADNNGNMVEVEDLNVSIVESSLVYNFIQQHNDDVDAFDLNKHSLDYALEYIITRGKAEITRQIKTAEKLAYAKAAGVLLETEHLTIAQAQALIAEAKRLSQQNGHK